MFRYCHQAEMKGLQGTPILASETRHVPRERKVNSPN
jgi:hypothetical protein